MAFTLITGSITQSTSRTGVIRLLREPGLHRYTANWLNAAAWASFFQVDQQASVLDISEVVAKSIRPSLCLQWSGWESKSNCRQQKKQDTIPLISLHWGNDKSKFNLKPFLVTVGDILAYSLQPFLFLSLLKWQHSKFALSCSNQ